MKKALDLLERRLRMREKEAGQKSVEVSIKMRNETTLIKYRYMAPIYDALFNPFLVKARKKALALLEFKSKGDILITGIGTGLDLPYIPKDCFVTGIDLSEEMLNKARRKIKNGNVELFLMNAENLEFENQTFDGVVLNLILSVAGNPKAVMSEAVRVLNDDGKILVFDKFIKGEEAGIIRKLLNQLTSFIGTDITRRFEEIIAGLPVVIVRDEDSIFRGNYRIILLEKAVQ